MALMAELWSTTQSLFAVDGNAVKNTVDMPAKGGRRRTKRSRSLPVTNAIECGEDLAWRDSCIRRIMRDAEVQPQHDHDTPSITEKFSSQNSSNTARQMEGKR